jgi:hypothetical protein
MLVEIGILCVRTVSFTLQASFCLLMRLASLMKEKLIRVENLHDYVAIVLVGGRCRADSGSLGNLWV